MGPPFTVQASLRPDAMTTKQLFFVKGTFDIEKQEDCQEDHDIQCHPQTWRKDLDKQGEHNQVQGIDAKEGPVLRGFHAVAGNEQEAAAYADCEPPGFWHFRIPDHSDQASTAQYISAQVASFWIHGLSPFLE